MAGGYTKTLSCDQIFTGTSLCTAFYNHVVTHAYLPEMKKWALLDPTFNAYILGENGNPLDIFEVRDRLKDQRPLQFNSDFHYNGSEFSKEEYTTYLAKELSYFSTTAESRFAAEDDNPLLYVCPKNFDVPKARISNIEYRIRKAGDNKELLEWLELDKTKQAIYISKKELLAVPK